MFAALLFALFSLIVLLSGGVALIVLLQPPERTTKRRAREAFWKALSVPTVGALTGSLGMAALFWMNG